MGSRYRFRPTTTILILMALCGVSQRVAASPFVVLGPFAFEEDPTGTLFGRVANEDCGSGGICAGVAAINSFVYLENRYPNVYDNLLTPHRNAQTDPQNGNDRTDVRQFAGCQTCGVLGWQDPPNPGAGHNDDSPASPQDDLGYYNRFGPTATFPNLPPRPPGATANTLYMDTKMDWFNDFAPSRTMFDMLVNDNTNAQAMLDFLIREIRGNEDVEFFVKDAVFDGIGELSFYHAMTMTGIACSTAGNCTINFIDPNGPTVYMGVPIDLLSGHIQFRSGVFDQPLYIDALFSESPIPEPSTILLIGSGIVAIVWRKLRRTNGTDA